MPCSRIVAGAFAAAMVIASPMGAAAAEPQFGAWGVDLAARDLSVSPGGDFYHYAVGTWIKQTKLPSDKVSYGEFERLDDLAQAAIRELIEAAAAGQSSDPDAGRVGAAYRSFMDEARADALDDKPLAPALARIRAETTKADVAALMGTQHTGFQATIFGVLIGPDAKAPERYAVTLRALASGLPDRDYYLKPEFADAKAKYLVYVASILRMIAWPDPDANAKAIVDLETRFAEARWTRAQLRNPDANYHAMTVEELARFAPGFDFRKLLDAAELGAVDRVIVRTDTAFPKFAAIFAETPLDTIKAWQAFSLANRAAPYLSKRFVDARFAFYGRTLGGQEEDEPRWKRAVDFADRSLGEAIGRMYVTAHFPPGAKAQAEEMVGRIIAAMHARIDRAAWMSAATKLKAHEKLARMIIKIAYPAKWRAYGALAMKPDDLYGNSERAETFDWEYDVHRLNDPVDKTEWSMNPQDVNAGYESTSNALTFPAAILQPPFFDPNADMAVNYGGIGAVIGHEITHGFDDEGRKYDVDGKLAEWWTPQDAASFQARADRLAAQFDKFEPVKGYFVNGPLTLGEDIADLGGVLLALDAYHAELAGKTAPVLDGLTGDQRLFLGFAQVWRGKITEQAAIMALRTDVHAPNQFRVIGVVRNISAWYGAFNIGPRDEMYLAPADRVDTW